MMPKLRKLAFALLLSAPLIALAQVSIESVPESKPSAERENLASLLEHAMQGNKTPALGALVMQEGKITQQIVRGVRRNDQPLSALDTDVWMIGSTAKPMTVTLIAKLVDRGVLAWDKTLSQMLPKLATGMRPEYRDVTLLQLVSHQSGLPRDISNGKTLTAFFADKRPLAQQRLAYIKAALKEKPVASRGTPSNYCNTGFVIAAVIAEQAMASNFEQLMQSEVFLPLEMKSANFGPTQEGQIRGHRAGKPVLHAPMEDADGVPLVYTATGYVTINLHDWALFCLDQMAGVHGGGKILKPESYRLMQSAQAGGQSGLDWGIQDSIAGRKGPVLLHGGSDGNWLAWVALFPESKSGVLVVANAAEDMDGDQTSKAVLGGLFPQLSTAK
jgi:CubicO group peptidase (beta-lactamase class C family)